MTRKLNWSKNYSAHYLADLEYRDLSFAAHGMLKVINDILWTQTDEPGKYVVKGAMRTLSELVQDALKYANRSRRGRNDVHMRTITELLKAHALEQDEMGLIYSPFILKEVEKLKVAHKDGKKGGNPTLNPRDNPTHNRGGLPRDREIERDRDKERDREPSGSIGFNPRESFPRPTAAAMHRKDRQIEVLNHLEGRSGEDHPSGGTLYRIGEWVPDVAINTALASVRDKKPDRPTSYYLASIRNYCHENGIETPIQWGNGKETTP